MASNSAQEVFDVVLAFGRAKHAAYLAKVGKLDAPGLLEGVLPVRPSKEDIQAAFQALEDLEEWANEGPDPDAQYERWLESRWQGTDEEEARAHGVWERESGGH